MDSSNQIKRYLDIAWRRKWWILVPTLVSVLTASAMVAFMPKVFRASTTILVMRQSVPEDIIRSTVTLRIEERMKSLQIQVFSRTYLEQIAREFDLVPQDASEIEIERACGRVRAKVSVEFDKRDFSWFRIAVVDNDAKRAAGIANRLAGLFIEQNTRLRATQAAGTLETIEGWVEKTKAELDLRDRRIAEYKQRYMYELPDQQPANLQLLNASQNRLNQLTSDIQIKSDRLALLRAQDQARRTDAAASGIVLPTSDPGGRIAALQRELNELLAVYTEENPVVKRKREQIAEAIRSQPPETPAAPGAAATPADPLLAQISQLENEIKTAERDRTREIATIDTIRKRIDNTPIRQQELAALTRDYDSLRADYNSSLQKQGLAERAQDLEESKKGEQFQIQDRAHPPAVPYSPNLLQFLLVGLGVGIAIGAGATAGRELMDQAIRSEEEFVAAFPDVAVFGAIPSLDVDPKDRHRPSASGRSAGPRVAVGLGWVCAVASALHSSGGLW